MIFGIFQVRDNYHAPVDQWQRMNSSKSAKNHSRFFLKGNIMKKSTMHQIQAAARKAVLNGNIERLSHNYSGDIVQKAFNGFKYLVKLDNLPESRVRRTAAAIHDLTAVALTAHLRHQGAQQAALDFLTDEEGFALIGGENSQLVCRGTLSDCSRRLPEVTNCDRHANGIGAWMVVKGDEIIMSGWFDREMAW